MSREGYIGWEYSTGAQWKTTLEWPLIGSGDAVIIVNEVVQTKQCRPIMSGLVFVQSGWNRE